MSSLQDRGTTITATATNSTSAVATVNAVAGLKYFVTDVSGSSDKTTALILIKDGTTVIWQDRVSSTGPCVYNFSKPMPITAGNLVSVTVDGTAMCNANIQGFSLPVV